MIWLFILSWFWLPVPPPSGGGAIINYEDQGGNP